MVEVVSAGITQGEDVGVVAKKIFSSRLAKI